ncbi:conserved protein of unknown function [Cyanobium sp. NIES-981]|nr:conserved protein of unknown function [Cyanobium sp. NIES-981]
MVEFLTPDGTWEPQQLSLTMPGFRLNLISLLLCQHTYLVANARERQLPLQRVEASFEVATSSSLIVERVAGDFRMALDPTAGAEDRARVDAEAIAWMQERMTHCPISRNLPEGVSKRIGLRLVEA